MTNQRDNDNNNQRNLDDKKQGTGVDTDRKTASPQSDQSQKNLGSKSPGSVKPGVQDQGSQKQGKSSDNR